VKTFFGTKASDYAPPVVILIVTLVYLATAYTYTPEARAFPATVAWASLVLACLDIVSRTKTPAGQTLVRWFNPAAASEKSNAHPSYPVSTQLIAIGWVVAFVALMLLAGILVAVPTLVFASMLLRGKFAWWLSALIAASVTGAIWFVFEQVLMLELYRGLLFGAL
jgi:hypothetical protein